MNNYDQHDFYLQQKAEKEKRQHRRCYLITTILTGVILWLIII
jgi:hypothetical protein